MACTHVWAYLDRHMYIETFRSTHLDRHILRNTETLLSPVTAPQDVINMSPRCRASAELLIRRHTLLHRVKKCAQIIASLNNSRSIRFHDSLLIIVQEFTVYKLPCSMPSAASFHTRTALHTTGVSALFGDTSYARVRAQERSYETRLTWAQAVFGSATHSVTPRRV